jgi:hypothetical protein
MVRLQYWKFISCGDLTGDLRPVEIKMKQIIEEQDAAKMDKDEERLRQTRLANLKSTVISGSAISTLKPLKKAKIISDNGKENQVVVSKEMKR